MLLPDNSYYTITIFFSITIIIMLCYLTFVFCSPNIPHTDTPCLHLPQKNIANHFLNFMENKFPFYIRMSHDWLAALQLAAELCKGNPCVNCVLNFKWESLTKLMFWLAVCKAFQLRMFSCRVSHRSPR